MNYPIIALVIILAAAFIALLVWKNIRDEKKIEKEMNQAELEPEKHNEHKPKI